MSDRHLCKAKRANGEWVEGYLIKDIPNPDKAYIGYLFGVDNDGEVHDVDIAEVDPSTICQCTGRKDKNGKKIWENDICTVVTKYYNEDDGYFIVEWNENELRYILSGTYWNLAFDGPKDPVCEVKGNIYDNPELLEGGAE